jgi:radical SAM protein with 4Fe4S-binding SPASM domain
MVDKLADAKVMYLSLSGGEPFLRHDILDILNHIAHSGMRVDIASNGFRIPPGIIRALRDLPVFHIQVSIDGIGEAHDRFRGKPGAFEKSCRTLRQLKKEGISTSISTTATARNIDHLADLVDLAVALGCDSFKAIPFIPAGRGKRHNKELWLGPEGALKLSRTLAEKQRELEGRLNLSTEAGFLFLLDRPSTSQTFGGPMTCSAGYDTLSIGADGTVFPCPFLHDFPLGNVLTDSLSGIWHESSLLNQLRTLNKEEMTGPCANCEFSPLHCHGGCRAAAYFACGDLKGSDPLCFKHLPTGTNQVKITAA